MFKTYDETIDFLFNATPVFQHQGGSAYKPGLDTVMALDKRLDHPHKAYKTIHIGGTNGKGSTASTLAAILYSAGYRVGLFTSPHLVDFRERIRVNGQTIDADFVVAFCNRTEDFIREYKPSFFELTTMMAFDYFRSQHVDIAIIEVGMGGRLDSTNIINPILSIITNISKDHTQFLGETLSLIAQEKAGIIKSHTPIIIGATNSETRPVFEKRAEELQAPIYFAETQDVLLSAQSKGIHFEYQTKDYGLIYGQLGGLAQQENTRTILTAIRVLTSDLGIDIAKEAVSKGFAHVCELSGLLGRWQQISDNPRIICDTGHNIGGFELTVKQLMAEKYEKLHIVIGMVNDKDISAVLSILPKNALYYFTKASVPRALLAEELKKLAQAYELQGNSYANVQLAMKAVKDNAIAQDLIFVGGSNFIVADVLANKEITN